MINKIILQKWTINGNKFYLITVCKTTHTTHDAKDIVVSGVDTDLSGGFLTDASGRKDKLQGSVIDSGHIACTGWLVLFWAKCKRVAVNTGVGGTSVMLVRLDNIEVRTFTLRHAVLSVKLKLSSDNRVFTPQQ